MFLKVFTIINDFFSQMIQSLKTESCHDAIFVIIDDHRGLS